MVKAGWEMVADADPVKIRHGLTDFTPPEERPEIFGDGHAADKIITSLLERYGGERHGAQHYPTGIVNSDSLASLAMGQLSRNLPVIERTDSMHQTVSLVIPCFNEEDSLPMLFYRLDNLRKTINTNLYRLEYVLVDDGSTDASWKMLANKYEADSRVRLVRHEENLGYGAALKRGLEGATGDVIVTVDADTNYDLLETPSLIQMMGDGVDIVTASPFLTIGIWNYPLHRFFLSRGVVMLYRFLLKEQAQDIKTFTSCFRAYRRECLPLVTPEADDFLANAEILVRALVSDLNVSQVPMVIFERKFGKSKLKTIKTTFRHLGFMWRLWMGKITPRPSPPAIN
jgi:dolichol-phosphate mannosyltransferase